MNENEPGSVADIEDRILKLLDVNKPLTLEQVAEGAAISHYQAGVALTNLRRRGLVKTVAGTRSVKHTLKG